jgi:parallel beta-helix repeat protein
MLIHVHLILVIIQRMYIFKIFLYISINFWSFFRIGIWDTNGVPITNNTVYNTYESAIVTTGQNNIIQSNLVSTIYWSGEAEPEYAAFNTNNDGAIMSTNAISVIMKVDFCVYFFFCL